jgi:hypothetical protein
VLAELLGLRDARPGNVDRQRLLVLQRSCGGWGYWYLNGVMKTCYPGCDPYNGTNGKILYGFENRDRIRGNFTSYYGKRYVQPGELGMGGYLRAQVTWWAGTTSQINVAVAG